MLYGAEGRETIKVLLLEGSEEFLQFAAKTGYILPSVLRRWVAGSRRGLVSGLLSPAQSSRQGRLRLSTERK